MADTSVLLGQSALMWLAFGVALPVSIAYALPPPQRWVGSQFQPTLHTDATRRFRAHATFHCLGLALAVAGWCITLWWLASDYGEFALRSVHGCVQSVAMSVNLLHPISLCGLCRQLQRPGVRSGVHRAVGYFAWFLGLADILFGVVVLWSVPGVIGWPHMVAAFFGLWAAALIGMGALTVGLRAARACLKGALQCHKAAPPPRARYVVPVSATPGEHPDTDTSNPNTDHSRTDIPNLSSAAVSNSVSADAHALKLAAIDAHTDACKASQSITIHPNALDSDTMTPAPPYPNALNSNVVHTQFGIHDGSRITVQITYELETATPQCP